MGENAKQKSKLNAAQERCRVAGKLSELVLKFTGQMPADRFKRSETEASTASGVFSGKLRRESSTPPWSRTGQPEEEFELEGKITRDMFVVAMEDHKVDELLDDLE